MTDTDKIIQELEMLAPLLANIKKSNLKDIPNGYFNDVEEQILSQIRLDSYKSTDSKVPEGYFESMEDKIINTTLKDNLIVTPFYRTELFRYLIAASVIFVLTFIGYHYVSNEKSASLDNLALSQFDEAVLFQYLNQNIEELDIYTLIDQGIIEDTDLTIITFNESELEGIDDQSFIFDSETNF